MKTTNWEEYYQRPYKTATFSRSITTRRLINYIQKHTAGIDKLQIVELGGANSCFYESIVSQVTHAQYCIIDNNDMGLQKFEGRFPNNTKTITCNQDVLNLDSDIQADLVFSVGLIEHFEPEQTKTAIEAHFKLLKPGGTAIISFPTPTFLYNTTRKLSELLGMWIFHDERPLTKEEVFPTIEEIARIKEWQIIWPIFLTQLMLVAKKPK